ncbi:MAG: glutathione S-transferase family protein [Burkholderiales bacterium]
MVILYHDWDAFCCIKVRFCMAEKNIPWTGHVVNLQQLDQLRPEYLALNANGVVPTLVHDDRVITESSVINEYLNEVFPGVSLVPADPFERALMRIWVKYADDVLHPVVKLPTYQLMMRHAFAKLPRDLVEERIARAPNKAQAEKLRASVGGAPADLDAVAAARQIMERALARIEARLDGCPWFAGEHFSLADIAISPFIDRLEWLGYMGMWSARAAIESWIRRMKDRPAYREAMPRKDQRLPVPNAL